MSAHLTSSHLFSPLLTSSKLFSHLLTSSQLLSALPSSCQLFSPQLSSSQLTLRSSQLFSGPKPAPKPHLGARAEKSTILKLVQRHLKRKMKGANTEKTQQELIVATAQPFQRFCQLYKEELQRGLRGYPRNSHAIHISLYKQDCTDT